MSSRLYRILIDDLKLGQTHRCVLRYALGQNFQREFEVIFASSINLNFPSSWQVKTEVALSLAAKLWIFENPIPQGKTLYLDGNNILQGNISELFEQEGLSFLQAARREPLSKLQFFLVNHAARDSQQLTQRLIRLAEQEYGKLANVDDLDISLLPSGWSPLFFSGETVVKVIDCQSIGDRPWYSCFAPSGTVWFAQVKAAITEGYLSVDNICQDVATGLVRPSLIVQIDKGIDNPFQLPKQLIELDDKFTYPELAVSAKQLKSIESNIFPPPKRILTRVIFSRYFIEIEVPERILQVRRAIQKILNYFFVERDTHGEQNVQESNKQN